MNRLSLAVWSGGALMGAVSLNGATIEVDDPTQRTRVANAGWSRWAPWAGAALLTHLATALPLGCLEVPTGRSARASFLAQTRTAVTAAAVAATAITGLAGRRMVEAGDVPVATAVSPIDATPADVATMQRVLRTAQWLVPLTTALLWVLDTMQQQPTPT